MNGARTAASDPGYNPSLASHSKHTQTPPPHSIPSAIHLSIHPQQATGLDKALSAASDPAYTAPKLDDDSAPVNLEFPWWFGYKAPPPSPSPSPAPAAEKPAPAGIPAAGPYTVRRPGQGPRREGVGAAHAAQSALVCAC